MFKIALYSAANGGKHFFLKLRKSVLVKRQADFFHKSVVKPKVMSYAKAVTKHFVGL